MARRADELAKRAAESVSLGQPLRRRLQDQFDQAKQFGIFAGRLTHEAGAHKMSSGDVARDSVVLDQRLPRKVNPRTRTT